MNQDQVELRECLQRARLNQVPIEQIFDSVQAVYGRSLIDEGIKRMKQRVNPERDKRKKFPPSLYQRLYNEQGGDCSICGKRLEIPARKNEIDHINPNESNFNGHFNLQLVHRHCNRNKSSKDMIQQSKQYGKPISELIKGGSIEET